MTFSVAIVIFAFILVEGLLFPAVGKSPGEGLCGVALEGVPLLRVCLTPFGIGASRLPVYGLFAGRGAV